MAKQVIRKACYANRHERLVCLLSDLGGLIDLLVVLLSFTYYVSDFRARVLFSNWAEPE